jgi:F-type H+-transporting ATPase subunit alpha
VVAKYEAGLYPFIEGRYPDLFTKLAEKRAIDSEIEDQLNKALTAYDEEFKDTI